MVTLSEKVINSNTNSAGAFGNVKIGWLKSSPNKKFAIKTMKKHEIIQSKHVDHIENEKNILEHLDHPFAVSYSLFVQTTVLALLRWILSRLTLHLLCDRAAWRRRSLHLPQRGWQLQCETDSVRLSRFSCWGLGSMALK